MDGDGYRGKDTRPHTIYRSVRPGGTCGILCGERIVKVHEGVLCFCMAIQCSRRSEW